MAGLVELNSFRQPKLEWFEDLVDCGVTEVFDDFARFDGLDEFENFSFSDLVFEESFSLSLESFEALLLNTRELLMFIADIVGANPR